MPTKLLAASILFLSGILTLEAQEKIGETVYLDGEVSITRDGSALDSSAVVIGVLINNFDLMQTGDDGNAQVKITTTKAAASTITVSPDTQFSFELSTLQGRQASSVNLISGSLSLKVSKLAGSQDLEIQTESSVLGVRGTEFNVSTSDAGDVLVTCATGAVACTTENGTEYQAVPGTVVENEEGSGFRTVPVAVADLESFRRTWGEQRRAAVRANATRLIQANVIRYRMLRAAYDKSFTDLMNQREVISKWTAEDRGGRVGTAAEVEREKRAVAATMLRLRRTQFLLERVQFRLLRLKRLHDQGYGKGALPGGSTTSEFFDQLQRERGSVESRMATVRNITRLYAARNAGADPTAYSVLFRRRLLNDSAATSENPSPDRPERPLRRKQATP